MIFLVFSIGSTFLGLFFSKLGKWKGIPQISILTIGRAASIHKI
jgi:hypothetical protein